MEITRHKSNRLNFASALVIEEAGDLRNSVMALLRKCGWLVHGISRAEHAFNLLVSIPYDLIVLDSELPGICGIDFVRILQNSREWRTIRLVVMTSSRSPRFARRVEGGGAFLARKATWEDDLFGFLSTCGEYSQITRPAFNGCRTAPAKHSTFRPSLTSYRTE
jgi:CheY-like chemotaxis protein